MAATAEEGTPLGDRQEARTGPVARRLEDVRTILGVVALGVYLVLRAAYGQFYEEFGLSPDDLGWGYLELVTQSALATLIVLLEAVIFAFFIMALVVAGTAKSMAKRLFPLLALFPLLFIDIRTEKDLALVIAAMALMGALGLVEARRGLRSQRVVLRRAEAAWWRDALLLAVAATVVGSSYLLVSQARNDAEAVLSGRPAHATLFDVRVTSWGAVPATLRWRERPDDSALERLADQCLMFLGSADGTVFAVDAQGDPKATYRLPASAVVVRIVENARCVDGRLRQSAS